ncbi:hypothetical protein TR51_17440 [Kitasatospora griseola]|uniref:Uncharacterized protein n=1 Tax=Kitasatospora griseola TaxID=2064 RepID=A0A0D0NBI2_KITGR|nr:hypothetical protein [Kitasatospora griseola]KIQ65605.1 hypothetical protein TR51_17440 [Kitasatospora griseola]
MSGQSSLRRVSCTGGACRRAGDRAAAAGPDPSTRPPLLGILPVEPVIWASIAQQLGAARVND